MNYLLDKVIDNNFSRCKPNTFHWQLDIWKYGRYVGDYVDIRVPFHHQAQFNIFLATSK